MNRGNRRHRQVGYARRGQAAVELALILPVIALMLLGLVELAGVFSAKLNVQAAAAQGARIGALEGNGSNNNCTASANTVDTDIISAVLSNSGVSRNNVKQIQIYRAAPNGSVDNGAINTYKAPFTLSGAPPLYAITPPESWHCTDRQSAEPADSIGVHVTYNYQPVVSLPGVSSFTLEDRTVQRLNPTKNSQPCPFPGVPTSVGAQWIGSKPSTTDDIVWLPVPGADTYQVFANVNNAQWGTTPIFDGPPPSPLNGKGQVEITYAHNTTSGTPIQYRVRGHNFCGDGQFSLPAAPTVNAIPDPSTPGNDYLTWSQVPDASYYTVIQLPSDGSATNVSPPPPSPGSIPATSSPHYSMPHVGAQSDTYVVYAESLGNKYGPLSAPVSVAATGGYLSGSEAAPSAVANLTSEGSIDWMHWGLQSPPSPLDIDRKRGTGLITSYTIFNTGGGPVGSASQYPNSSDTGYNWTDGFPNLTPNTAPLYLPTKTGVSLTGQGNGFQFKVPADTTTRVLRVYVGVKNATGLLTAKLLDSSAPMYNSTSLDASGTTANNGIYTLTYRAASTTQLQINFSMLTDHGSGSVILQAATLALAPVTGGTPTLIDDNASPFFSYDNPRWVRCTTCDSTDSPAASHNASTSDSTTGDTVTLSFTGTSVKLYGVKSPDGGIASITIDNNNTLDPAYPAPPDTIDFYASARTGNALMWSSPTTLSAGSHVVTIKVTGTKNVNSTGYAVTIDGAGIQN